MSLNAMDAQARAERLVRCSWCGAAGAAVEEWMLICQRNSDLQPDLTSQQEFDWSQPARL